MNLINRDFGVPFAVLNVFFVGTSLLGQSWDNKEGTKYRCGSEQEHGPLPVNTAQQRTTSRNEPPLPNDEAKSLNRILSHGKSSSTTRMNCFAGHRQSVRPVYHHLRFWNVDTW